MRSSSRQDHEGIKTYHGADTDGEKSDQEHCVHSLAAH